LFFFEIDYDENGKVSPFALIELGEIVNDIKWSSTSKKLLLCTNKGKVHELIIPDPKNCDHTETFIEKLNH